MTLHRWDGSMVRIVDGYRHCCLVVVICLYFFSSSGKRIPRCLAWFGVACLGDTFVGLGRVVLYLGLCRYIMH